MSGKAIRKIGSVFAALFLMLFMVISTIWGGKDSALVAFAEETPGYDATNVLDDLEGGGKIDGKAFALNDYPFDEDCDIMLWTLFVWVNCSLNLAQRRTLSYGQVDCTGGIKK